MNQQQESRSRLSWGPRRGVPGLLLLLLFLLLVTIGVGARFFLYGPSASLPFSIFDQAPGPSTNQPLSAQTVSHLHPVWSYRLAPNALSKMVVANGTMFITVVGAAREYLAAIQDGKQLWRYQTPDTSPYLVALQVGGDAVYLATETAVYAVNAHTGQALWHFQPDAPVHFRGATNDLVYADAALYVSTTEQVYALDAASGKPQWSYRFADSHLSPYNPVAPSLVAASGTLYVFLTTSPYVAEAAVTALDARLGTVRWQIQEMGADTIAQSPAPLVGDNGVIYRPLAQGVSALDAQTGRALWTVATDVPGRPRHSGMSIDSQRLYVAGPGWVQAYALSTGHLLWSSARLAGNRSLSGPVVSNGVVYFATDTPFTGHGYSLFGPSPRAPHWLYAFDAPTGKLVRMLQADDSSFEPQVLSVDGAHLYVGGSRSFVAADAAAQGKPEIYALGA